MRLYGGVRRLRAGEPASGAERTGQGARPSPSGGCRLPGGSGLPRVPRAGRLDLLFLRSWKLLGESFIFYLHVKRYRCH